MRSLPNGKIERESKPGSRQCFGKSYDWVNGEKMMESVCKGSGVVTRLNMEVLNSQCQDSGSTKMRMEFTYERSRGGKDFEMKRPPFKSTDVIWAGQIALISVEGMSTSGEKILQFIRPLL